MPKICQEIRCRSGKKVQEKVAFYQTKKGSGMIHSANSLFPPVIRLQIDIWVKILRVKINSLYRQYLDFGHVDQLYKFTTILAPLL